MTSPAPRLLTLLKLGLAACVLLGGADAFAQFKNHTIGFEAGYMVVGRSLGASSGPVIGIDSSLYIENGFDLFFRVAAGIHEDLLARSNSVGFFPAMGVRYLFSEEHLQPFLGANLAFMHFFGSPNLPPALFSVSPNVGLSYYFTEDFSVGLQAEYHLILSLNQTPAHAFAPIARVAWGF
ncbi:MAG: hypothetical protein ACK4N5_24770 [Myxococcales bacterium]